MHTNQKTPLRVVAAFLVVTFTASELQAAPISVRPNMTASERLLNDPTALEVPAAFSSLNDIRTGTNGKFIIHIQDAHSNFSGQDNLASTLDSLMKKYGISLVLSEGGYGDCTLTPIKSIAKPEVWKRVARSFLMSGKLQGEEYLNLVSDNPMKIMGVEDAALYEKSVDAYRKLAEKRESILARLDKLDRAISKLKNKLYPDDLKAYEKIRSDNAGFERSFDAFLSLAKTSGLDAVSFPELTKLALLRDEERLINFELANLEQAVMAEEVHQKGGKDDLEEALKKMEEVKANKVALFTHFQNTLNIAQEKGVDVQKFRNLGQYVAYLRKFSSIDFDRLLPEYERAEDELYKKIITATGSAERDDALILRSVDRFIKLVTTAHEIKMTADQYALLKFNEPDFRTESMEAFLNRKLAEEGYFEDMIPVESLLEEGRAALDDFYASVTERDHAFMQNVDALLESEDQKIAFLITGGYHTRHLKKLLQEKGYGYSVLAPMVSSETNQRKYEALLLSDKAVSKKKVHLNEGRASRKDKSLADADDDLAKLMRKKKDGVRAGLLAINGSRLSALADAVGSTLPESKIQEMLKQHQRGPVRKEGSRLAESDEQQSDYSFDKNDMDDLNAIIELYKEYYDANPIAHSGVTGSDSAAGMARAEFIGNAKRVLSKRLGVWHKSREISRDPQAIIAMYEAWAGNINKDNVDNSGALRGILDELFNDWASENRVEPKPTLSQMTGFDIDGLAKWGKYASWSMITGAMAVLLLEATFSAFPDRYSVPAFIFKLLLYTGITLAVPTAILRVLNDLVDDSPRVRKIVTMISKFIKQGQEKQPEVVRKVSLFDREEALRSPKQLNPGQPISVREEIELPEREKVPVSKNGARLADRIQSVKNFLDRHIQRYYDNQIYSHERLISRLEKGDYKFEFEKGLNIDGLRTELDNLKKERGEKIKLYQDWSRNPDAMFGYLSSLDKASQRQAYLRDLVLSYMRITRPVRIFFGTIDRDFTQDDDFIWELMSGRSNEALGTHTGMVADDGRLMSLIAIDEAIEDDFEILRVLVHEVLHSMQSKRLRQGIFRDFYKAVVEGAQREYEVEVIAGMARRFPEVMQIIENRNPVQSGTLEEKIRGIDSLSNKHLVTMSAPERIFMNELRGMIGKEGLDALIFDGDMSGLKEEMGAKAFFDMLRFFRYWRAKDDEDMGPLGLKIAEQVFLMNYDYQNHRPQGIKKYTQIIQDELRKTGYFGDEREKYIVSREKLARATDPEFNFIWFLIELAEEYLNPQDPDSELYLSSPAGDERLRNKLQEFLYGARPAEASDPLDPQEAGEARQIEKLRKFNAEGKMGEFKFSLMDLDNFSAVNDAIGKLLVGTLGRPASPDLIFTRHSLFREIREALYEGTKGHIHRYVGGDEVVAELDSLKSYEELVEMFNASFQNTYSIIRIEGLSEEKVMKLIADKDAAKDGLPDVLTAIRHGSGFHFLVRRNAAGNAEQQIMDYLNVGRESLIPLNYEQEGLGLFTISAGVFPAEYLMEYLKGSNSDWFDQDDETRLKDEKIEPFYRVGMKIANDMLDAAKTNGRNRVFHPGSYKVFSEKIRNDKNLLKNLEQASRSLDKEIDGLTGLPSGQAFRRASMNERGLLTHTDHLLVEVYSYNRALLKDSDGKSSGRAFHALQEEIGYDKANEVIKALKERVALKIGGVSAEITRVPPDAFQIAVDWPVLGDGKRGPPFETLERLLDEASKEIGQELSLEDFEPIFVIHHVASEELEKIVSDNPLLGDISRTPFSVLSQMAWVEWMFDVGKVDVLADSFDEVANLIDKKDDLESRRLLYVDFSADKFEKFLAAFRKAQDLRLERGLKTLQSRKTGARLAQENYQLGGEFYIGSITNGAKVIPIQDRFKEHGFAIGGFVFLFREKIENGKTEYYLEPWFKGSDGNFRKENLEVPVDLSGDYHYSVEIDASSKLLRIYQVPVSSGNKYTVYISSGRADSRWLGGMTIDAVAGRLVRIYDDLDQENFILTKSSARPAEGESGRSQYPWEEIGQKDAAEDGVSSKNSSRKWIESQIVEDLKSSLKRYEVLSESTGSLLSRISLLGFPQNSPLLAHKSILMAADEFTSYGDFARDRDLMIWLEKNELNAYREIFNAYGSYSEEGIFGHKNLPVGFSYRNGILMPYIQGRMLSYEESSDLSDYLQLLLEIGEPIAAFNELGYVHGDIKPSNFFIETAGMNQGGVVLFDFATSLPVGTSRRHPFLTQLYASPNQLDGGPASYQDDVYAFSVMAGNYAIGYQYRPVNELYLKDEYTRFFEFFISDEFVKEIVLKGLSAGYRSVAEMLEVIRVRKEEFSAGPEAGARLAFEELTGVARETAEKHNAKIEGQCVNATLYAVSALSARGIQSQRRDFHISYDWVKNPEVGDATINHTVLEVLWGGTTWVIDTQLLQFAQIKDNQSRLDDEFVKQYVYPAEEYYRRVPAYEDSVSIERIHASAIRGGRLTAAMVGDRVSAALEITPQNLTDVESDELGRMGIKADNLIIKKTSLDADDSRLSPGQLFVRAHLRSDLADFGNEYYLVFSDEGDSRLLAVFPKARLTDKTRGPYLDLSAYYLPIGLMSLLAQGGSVNLDDYQPVIDAAVSYEARVASFIRSNGLRVQMQIAPPYNYAEIDPNGLIKTDFYLLEDFKKGSIRYESLKQIFLNPSNLNRYLFPVLPSVYSPVMFKNADEKFWKYVYEEASVMDFDPGDAVLDETSGSGFMSLLTIAGIRGNSEKNISIQDLKFHTSDINVMAVENEKVLADIIGIPSFEAKQVAQGPKEGYVQPFEGPYKFITINAPESGPIAEDFARPEDYHDHFGEKYLRDLAERTPRLLAEDGVMMLWYEMGSEDTVTELFEQHGLSVLVLTKAPGIDAAVYKITKRTDSEGARLAGIKVSQEVMDIFKRAESVDDRTLQRDIVPLSNFGYSILKKSIYERIFTEMPFSERLTQNQIYGKIENQIGSQYLKLIRQKSGLAKTFNNRVGSYSKKFKTTAPLAVALGMLALEDYAMAQKVAEIIVSDTIENNPSLITPVRDDSWGFTGNHPSDLYQKNQQTIDVVQNKLGIERLNDKAKSLLALIFSNERTVKSNNKQEHTAIRMATLGDAVLNAWAEKQVADGYLKASSKVAHTMPYSIITNYLVGKQPLGLMLSKAGLLEIFVRESGVGKIESHYQADIFESILAALYLSYDSEERWEVVDKFLKQSYAFTFLDGETSDDFNLDRVLEAVNKKSPEGAELSSQQELWEKIYDDEIKSNRIRPGQEVSVLAEKLVKGMEISKGAQILTLGSWMGGDEIYFAQNGFRVTATDFIQKPLDELLKKAEQVGVQNNIQTKQQDLNQPLAFRDNEFDIVYAHLSLHYLDNATLKARISDISRILKPGGLVILAVKSTRDRKFVDAAKREGYFVIGEDGKRQRFFSEASLRSLFKDFETVIVDEPEPYERYVNESPMRSLELIATKPSGSRLSEGQPSDFYAFLQPKQASYFEEPERILTDQIDFQHRSYLNRYQGQWEEIRVSLGEIIEGARRDSSDPASPVFQALVLGSSTGEEIARTFHEVVTWLEEHGEKIADAPDKPGWKIEIHGVDRSRETNLEALRRFEGAKPFFIGYRESEPQDFKEQGLQYSREVVETLRRHRLIIPFSVYLHTGNIANPQWQSDDPLDPQLFELFKKPNLILANAVLYQLGADMSWEAQKTIDQSWGSSWIVANDIEFFMNHSTRHRISNQSNSFVVLSPDRESLALQGARLAESANVESDLIRNAIALADKKKKEEIIRRNSPSKPIQAAPRAELVSVTDELLPFIKHIANEPDSIRHEVLWDVYDPSADREIRVVAVKSSFYSQLMGSQYQKFNLLILKVEQGALRLVGKVQANIWETNKVYEPRTTAIEKGQGYVQRAIAVLLLSGRVKEWHSSGSRQPSAEKMYRRMSDPNSPIGYDPRLVVSHEGVAGYKVIKVGARLTEMTADSEMRRKDRGNLSKIASAEPLTARFRAPIGARSLVLLNPEGARDEDQGGLGSGEPFLLRLGPDGLPKNGVTSPNQIDLESLKLLSRAAPRIPKTSPGPTYNFAFGPRIGVVTFTASPTVSGIPVNLTPAGNAIEAVPPNIPARVFSEDATVDRNARDVRAVWRAALAVKNAKLTNYDGQKTVEFRYWTPAGFGSAQKAELEKWAELIGVNLGGKVLIQFASRAEDFVDLSGGKNKDEHAIVDMGLLSPALLKSAEGHGIASTALDGVPAFFNQMVFSTILQRLDLEDFANLPIDRLQSMWRYLRGNDTVELDVASLKDLKEVGAGANLQRYQDLAFRAMEVAWEEAVRSTWNALKTLGAAA